MNLKTVIVSAIVSAAVAAVVAASVFLFLAYSTMPDKIVDPAEKRVEISPTPTPWIPAPTPTPEEVRESEVGELTIETEYKNFFPAGSKCRQTYNEYFKNTDGVGSTGSPCNVRLTFGRDGRAEKTIEIERYDTTAKSWKVVEKESWKAEIPAAEFARLAKTVVTSQAFRNWSDNIMINVSNCKITAKFPGGSKSPMANVDDTATAYLPMVNAFKELDAKTGWTKAE